MKMKNMMKSLITFLMAAILLLGILPTAFAEEASLPAAEYAIFVNWGTAYNEAGEPITHAPAGAVVWVKADAAAVPSGSRVCGWGYSPNLASNRIWTKGADNYKFYMPAQDVSLSATFEIIREAGHVCSYTDIRVQPVNCSFRTHTFACCTCGSWKWSNEKAAAGHQYQETKGRMQDGTAYILHTCVSCGSFYYTEDETAPHVHNYSTETVIKAATCKKDGTVKLTCSCGESSTESIPMLGHDYKKTVVAPTEEAEGYTLHTCTRCGRTYKNNFKAKLEHTHSYTQVTVTKAATCTKAGSRTMTCSCGASVTENIPALGHSYKKTVVAPTEEAEGYTLHTCTRCGRTYRNNFKAKLEHTHSFTNPTVTQAATCTSDGIRTSTCSCGQVQTESIPATGHNYAKSSTVAPTTSSEGYTTYVCRNCQDSYRGDFTEKLPAPTPPSAPAETGRIIESAGTDIVRETNAARAAAGLTALSVDAGLQAAAELRAKELAELFSHTRPDGTVCFTAFPGGLTYCGENIAYCYSSAGNLGSVGGLFVNELWMNSTGHRANILSTNYNCIGCAVWYDAATGQAYAVQCFGRR